MSVGEGELGTRALKVWWGIKFGGLVYKTH